jgi:hypothetical protein
MAVSSRRIGAALTASRYVVCAGFGLALGLGSLTASAAESTHRQVELTGAPTRAIGAEAMPGPAVAMQSTTMSLQPSAAISKSTTSLRPVSAVINNEAPLRPTAALRNGATSLRPVAAIVDNGAPLRPSAALSNGQMALRPVAAIVNNGPALRPGAAMGNGAMALRPVAMIQNNGATLGVAATTTAHPTSMRMGALGHTQLRTTSVALKSQPTGKAIAVHSTLHWAKRHSH